MVSWKTNLKPGEMAQVASYVLSLHGTNPIDSKTPEGEIWIDPNAGVDDVQVKQLDSARIQVIMENDSTAY
jgi:cytochrome c oxidase cbb3-type subunit 3